MKEDKEFNSGEEDAEDIAITTYSIAALQLIRRHFLRRLNLIQAKNRHAVRSSMV